jgi:hypothetical protein
MITAKIYERMAMTQGIILHQWKPKGGHLLGKKVL